MSFHPNVIARGPWSVSKVDLLVQCERRYVRRYERHLDEGAGHTSAKLGTAAHAVLERGLPRGTRDVADLIPQVTEAEGLGYIESTQLSAFAGPIGDYIERVQAFKATHDVIAEYFEQKWGMTTEWTAAPFKYLPPPAPTCFFRGVVDHAMLTSDGYLIVIDHKSGRHKKIHEHTRQLYGYMLLALAQFPHLAGVQCGIHYLGQPVEWFPGRDGKPGAWSAAEIRDTLRPWMVRFFNAQASRLQAVAEVAPDADGSPSPSYLCGFCGFRASCPEGDAEARKRRGKDAPAGNV